MTELDELDHLAAEVFDGYLVKKDLAQQFRNQYPVPTYVGEFMLGRYCATTDPDEIAAGLEMVHQSMQDRTVRAGEEELFKHRARDRGRVKIIDLLRARLDSRSDAYKAELPSLQVDDIHISADLVDEHQRMLTGGFYAEVTLEYIAALASEQGNQPFRVEAVRPIQMSTRDSLATFIAARSKFTLTQWRDLLLRSVGFEPDRLTPRQQDVLIARMVPFVVRNYNAVELGPRGTGKSHLFQQISPYAHLVSGGKATVANMFVNMNSGRRGLVAQYDVICFDEVAGVAFDQREGVNILKGYMESGEFSRGREAIRAEGGIVFVGNFDVDVDTQLKVGHLLGPLPPEMRNDTAFMDRIHAYLPGWDVPKLNPSYFTDHFGFVSDYLAEVWTQLRLHPRLDLLQGRVEWSRNLSGRDRRAVNLTTDGLLRLLYPDPEMDVPDDFLHWAASLAVEMRRRVKEAQAYIGKDEFGDVDLSYRLGDDREVVVYCEESLRYRLEGGHRSRNDAGETKAADLLPKPDSNSIAHPVPARDYNVGDTIDNRFEVLERLGEGGFSTVYRVNDIVENVERALKLFDDATGYEAVRREIGALRKAKHPRIVDVIWAGNTSAGEWYLIMEYVRGESLAGYADGAKQLPDRQVLDVGLDVLDALIAIHPDSERLEQLDAKKRDGEITEAEYDELMTLSENALVHRDIKPHNIMLTRAGAKLLDFNIASRVGEPVRTLSGTPPYQPPDADLTLWDVSTDLFAVGVTLYELLCDGNHPYPGHRPMGGVEPTDPQQYRPDLPLGLREFLLRACGSERSKRFASATEMHAALKEVRAAL